MNDLITKYGMLPHPEGGYFRETYRSEFSTGILYLLGKGDQSGFHRIQSDEMWHFYQGDPLIIVEIDTNGEIRETEIGPHANFQYVVKARTWFGAYLPSGSSFALVGCTVAPAFHFKDFEMGSKLELLGQYPKANAMIKRLSK